MVYVPANNPGIIYESPELANSSPATGNGGPGVQDTLYPGVPPVAETVMDPVALSKQSTSTSEIVTTMGWAGAVMLNCTMISHPFASVMVS